MQLRDFVVVKRGFLNIHYYYIPITKVEGWDGHVLWINAIENEVKGSYERDKIPNPRRYYIQIIHTIIQLSCPN